MPNLLRTVFALSPLFLAAFAPSAWSAQAASQPQDLCSVAGKVTNESTGAPLRLALVVIAQFQPSSTTVPSGGYTLQTDAEGNYEATGVAPGAYRLMAQLAGFMTSDYGSDAPRKPAGGSPSSTPEGKTLNLAPGQKARGIDFKLRPFGVIAGRVVDANEEPVAGLQVAAMRFRYGNGTRALAGVASGSTNDLGEYRISGTPPDRYYVCVGPKSPPPGEDRSPRPAHEGYVATCHPGVADPNSATPVTVAAGQATTGANIKLVRKPMTVVRGRVLNLPVGASYASVALTPIPDAGILGLRTARPDAKGQFEFGGVTPGTYSLEASAGSAPRDLCEAVQEIQVGEEPVENITLPLSGGVELPGNVTIEEGGNVDLSKTRVSAIRMGGAPAIGGNPGTIAADGSFRMDNVHPWQLDVTVRPLPAGYYLKSARMGEQDVLANGLDMRGGAGGPLQLVLRAGAARIGGTVKDDQDAPVPGATVVVAPQDAARRTRYGAVKAARADATGKFNVQDIPPGEYKLFAWSNVETGAWLDPDFMRPVESQGVAVSVSENGSYNIDLKAIRQE